MPQPTRTQPTAFRGRSHTSAAPVNTYTAGIVTSLGRTATFPTPGAPSRPRASKNAATAIAKVAATHPTTVHRAARPVMSEVSALVLSRHQQGGPDPAGRTARPDRDNRHLPPDPPAAWLMRQRTTDPKGTPCPPLCCPGTSRAVPTRPGELPGPTGTTDTSHPIRQRLG